MLDHILSHTISNLIRKISGTASDMAKKNQKKDGRHGLTTVELGIIVIECLKNEAENIEEAFEHHEKKCTRGDDCGAKH
jgi:methylase of polypeptide subunit release factors